MNTVLLAFEKEVTRGPPSGLQTSY